ncbi:MAG: adenosylmethionine--8-amino-7-oxononanoate transaminase [Magnetococcales bacterium]|nr:adenosylmethionine--8-amino-7-oxononanoate transaminase [Magnetococcales bacterium]
MKKNIKKDQFITLDRNHVWHPFTQEATAPDPIPIISASGATLHAADNKKYLDLISSWWLTTHGHTHPKIAKAIAKQAKQLEQVIFAGFTHKPAVTLATNLIKILPKNLTRVFFSDNGSTSVEVALKMARQFYLNKGEKRDKFLAFEGGYHGDTVGAMSVGETTGFFNPFKPMLFPVDTIPFPQTWINDEDVEIKEQKALLELDKYLKQNKNQCAAVIIEPLVQGASGMRMCTPKFMQKMAEKVKQAGILLICDEVMTGFGRTGEMFASNKANINPDIICLSKGLTAGFMPLSVTVCTQEIYKGFLSASFDKAFAHGHSFTANSLSCSAAVASLKLFKTEKTFKKIAKIQKIHKQRLTPLLKHEKIEKPCITGSIAALNFKTKDPGYTSTIAPKLKEFFIKRGLLIRPLGNVLYLIPPYCISNADLHRAWDGIEAALLEMDY